MPEILQRLTIERGHLPGPVDFTHYVYEFNSMQMRKNEPTLFDFAITSIPGLGDWFTPTRGDYVRFEDFRWDSRYHTISPGLVFSGYITSGAQLEYLGVKDHRQHWGYRLKCTSEDYLINAKRVPARTFINQNRGAILRSLLEEMFEDSDIFPFDLSNMHDGGIERIYRTDPSKYWTELAADFGKSDGFTYMVMDRKVFYVPEMVVPLHGNSDRVLVIDEQDPRYTPANLDIKAVEASIVNDLTVIGQPEPTTVCYEQFVSDGYQPSYELTYLPYGLEETQLIVDDLGSEIDESVWEERDVEGSDYIQSFEGSLNVVGGPGTDTGLAFLRSRKGIELTGIITLRDGEIFFPPSPTGTGIIGGLYTADTCRQADLWCGWNIDLGTNRITPRGPSGLHSNWQAINPLFHYILRRTITVDRFAGLPTSIINPLTGHRYNVDPLPTHATIAWKVDVINTSDPQNILTTTTDLGTMYVTNPQFVLYAAIVPYSCHLAMNSISVTRPQQVHVEVDDVATVDDNHVWTIGRSPVIVGSSLDGGRCEVEANGNTAKLTWFALPTPTGSVSQARQDVTTVPPRGAIVSVRYYRSDDARARLRSIASIKTERAKFKDDGVRQLTLTAEDLTPAPRTSEECLFIAQAFVADRLRERYEGSYSFVTSDDDGSVLKEMIYPGDKLLCTVDTPEGELQEVVDITNVTVSIVGGNTYEIQLAFGPVNRLDNAVRELMRRRRSSLSEIIIPTVDSYELEELNEFGLDEVPDPVPPSVNIVGSDYITVTFGTSLQPGIEGYECRAGDYGWGQGGEIVRYTDHTRGFDRGARKVRYFFRAFRTLLSGLRVYSNRSALVRHTFPLRNKISLPGITAAWSAPGNVFKYFVPIPANPDFARVRVRSSATPYYEGDGVDHVFKLDHVNAFISGGKIQIEIKDIAVESSRTISVGAIDVLGQDADSGLQVNVTATK